MKLRNKKTGEIGFLIAGRGCNHYVVVNNEWDSCGKYFSLAELNEEWEDYEEPKEHWYLDYDGEALSPAEDLCNETQENMRQIGNYFETREEAERAVEKLKAWKRLRDDDFKFKGWYYDVDPISNGRLNIQIRATLDKSDNATLSDLELLFRE